MRAYVYSVDTEGKEVLCTGRVTPEYQSYTNMYRYYLTTLPKGTYNISLYYAWENRYKTPDEIRVLTIH